MRSQHQVESKWKGAFQEVVIEAQRNREKLGFTESLSQTIQNKNPEKAPENEASLAGQVLSVMASGLRNRANQRQGVAEVPKVGFDKPLVL